MQITGVLLEIKDNQIIIGVGGKKIKIKSTVLVDLNFLNLHVIVWVKTHRYKFKSTYEYNKGELIEGTSYTLIRIEHDTRGST